MLPRKVCIRLEGFTTKHCLISTAMVFVIVLLLFSKIGCAKNGIDVEAVDKGLRLLGDNSQYVSGEIIGKTVIINGAVNSEQAKQMISDSVKQIRNVSSVYNNVVVYPKLGICKNGYAVKTKDFAVDVSITASLKKEYLLGHLKDYRHINSYVCGGQVVVIGRSYSDKTKNKILGLVKATRGVSTITDLIVVDQDGYFSNPDDLLMTLDKAVKTGSVSLFLRCFTPETNQLYNQIIKETPRDIRLKAGIGDLITLLIKSHKSFNNVQVAYKNQNSVEIVPSVFSDVLNSKLILVKKGNEWRADIAEDIKSKYYSKIVEASINLGESIYDFDRMKGAAAKAKEYFNVAIRYDDENYVAYRNLGLLCYAEHKYSDAIKAFNKCITLDGSDFLPYYYMSMICANKLAYEDSLEFLRSATKCKNFKISSKDLREHFKNHPIVLYSVPDDIKDFANYSNQMFSLRKDAIQAQLEINPLILYTRYPSPEISIARKALATGDYDVAYINYMKFMNSYKALNDSNLDQFLEAASVWQFGFTSRIIQINKSLFDSKTLSIDEGSYKMVHPQRWKAVLEVSKQKPPSIVDSYRGRYPELMKVAISPPYPEANMCVSFILAGVPAAIISGEAYKLHIKTKRAHKLLPELPEFKLTEWEEAGLDYAKLMGQYFECMQKVEEAIEGQKKSGGLSPDSLKRLSLIKALFVRNYLYIDKLYRAFLFDFPLQLNIVNMNLRIDNAKYFYKFDDSDKIQEVGRQYSKLTPIIGFMVLDQTHREWEKTVKRVKKELSAKEYDELKQESKTVPDWLSRIIDIKKEIDRKYVSQQIGH